MKNIKTIIIIIILSSFFSSCEDWLDVSPKVEIKEKDLFKNESGYFDALFGVYNKLTTTSLYGDRLTMSFLDVLAHNYSIYSSHPYYYMTKFDYEHSTVKPIIEDIWSNMYNAIANANNIIINIDNSPNNIFTDSNKDIIKGEALALKALCHFDLIRMFGSSVKMGLDKKYIPYIDNLEIENTENSTTLEVLNKVIADLKEAETLLENDPIGQENPSIDNIYLTSRENHLNMFAVKALLARVNLYKGNNEEALKYAKQVIGKFHLTQNLVDVEKNRIFSQELLFCLFDNKIGKTADIYFSNPIASLALKTYSLTLENIYEKNNGGSSDVRYTKLFKVENYFGSQQKFLQKDNDRFTAKSKIPIIRLSEMYYIAAETTDKIEDANIYLNKVREARGLEEKSFQNKEEIIQYLVKEYRKEFFSEGQTFYLYKRLNIDNIPDCTTNISEKLEEVYIFKKPEQEIEFGSNK